MNFATLTYALFLLVVVVAYWLIPRRAGRWFLIAASLVFYGSWNPIYVPGFVFLIVANFLLGLLAAQPGRARLAVWLAVIVDIGILALFKYLDWVLGSSVDLVHRLTGANVTWGPLGLGLPLAISFVTFTTLAYVIDIARGGAPERNFGRFALFVSFFPHLIAGPIMRAHEFLPQVRRPRPFSPVLVQRALPLIAGGLLKKTIGDNLAPIVEHAFADPAHVGTVGLWLGVVAFAFQIFFDFSGYTDMALGSAWLMGFKLPRNFDWPYRSTSIQEFWRRWHMTLSRWLRDYLYISLGGNRKGRLRTYVNLIVTMLLGGLWHGAGLTFVIWGAWHGIGLAVHRYWRERLGHRTVIPTLVAWVLTFVFVLAGWVFFRSVDLASALTYLSRMVIPHGGRMLLSLTGTIALALVLGAMVAGQWPGWWPLLRRLAPDGSRRRYLAYGAGVTLAIALLPVRAIAFIYFQF
jgi:alginate O-acetyltransferase complex protein AlgI